MQRIIFVPALIVLFVVAAQAQRNSTRIDVSELGPQVGERVPDFQLVDQTGKSQTLQSIMGRRGAMLVFVRSADW
jgi:peroxiredoxin